MNDKKRIIALVGMAGSGKSSAIAYLEEKFSWPKVYFGDVIFDRLKADGLEITNDNERAVREKIRDESGMGACAELSLPKVRKALEQSDTVLVESLYSWDEYKVMKREFGGAFEVVAVCAPARVRLERLARRPRRPIATAEELQLRDWSEIEKTDKGGPIALADYTVVNAGTLEELYQALVMIFPGN